MLIRNCRLIIDGKEEISNIIVSNGKIVVIDNDIKENFYENVIDARGNYLLP